jgi:exonuclease SbcD
MDAATGLNSRILDFERSLALCLDRAIAEPADLVLFGGDAFPDATPPPIVQQIFARQFRRLADAGIPTVLLVGNHDQHSQGQGGASLAIYRSLGVPGFVVGERLETHRITTRHGDVQVVTLPWLTRSALLTRQETEGLSMAEVSGLLRQRLDLALEGELRTRDPGVPTVLLAHLMVEQATYGAERFLSAGQGFTVPLALLCRPEFAYVALGHVHRHQILCPDPPVVYAGSIERVDFGEESEEKGYCWVTIAEGNTDVQFCPIPARRFCTVTADITAASEPQAQLLEAIARKDIQDAITRVRYRLRPEQVSQIDDRRVHQALAAAHSYSIVPEVIPPHGRSRLSYEDTQTAIDPLTALASYLALRPDLQDMEPDLLAAAADLMQYPDAP